jgi:hypothetical protein
MDAGERDNLALIFARTNKRHPTVDPKTPRPEQDFGEFRMQFVGPGF